MERMLEYIKGLNSINTDGVEPCINIYGDGNNVFREDIAKDNNEKKNVLKNAPQREEDFFVVPKTV